MRRLPAPVETFLQKARYQESHMGFPILVRIFMESARRAGYFLFGILYIGLAILTTTTLVSEERWAWRFVAAFLTVQFILIMDVLRWSSLDILGRVGYTIFWRLLRQ